ncbi:ABC transporter ATP-binding protein [Ramlibacter sp.]|uniref:ABC transporter ATP-binding protein n=1 Tax=Ramlibacter sp. TaxID=1917967 RepID=UPI002621B3C0|nr:ABC transporter ATP-binding protein [Ramlibacter sp.]MDB5956522.1 ATP-binding protein [Ramlibacter sp.]
MLEIREMRRLHVGPVSLRLGSGSCVSIEGASGSGKSVLLRMVADLDPHEGDCFLDGHACTATSAPAWRRMVTYVPADSGWWHERVGDHFARTADLPQLLAAVGMDAAAAAWPVARLSTGERQRLALLRALHPGNRVLLLDEPTSGLDEQSRSQVEQLLRQLLDQGTAILLVTHDGALAQRMASERFEMRKGRLEGRVHA